jgi:3,4-dihydroxy 2-butanone 4-phosphate synthase/GTP cyclohydrolase II
MGLVGLAAVDDAVDDVRHGRPVVLLADEEGRRPALVMVAAELASAYTVAGLLRLGHGALFLALSAERCDQLGLEPVARDVDRWPYELMTSIDSREVRGAGAGAADRAVTVRAAMAGPASRERFTSPGHVIPLRAVDGGTLERVGTAEAAVDLARLAGFGPAAVLCETSIAPPAIGLKAVTPWALVAHRRATEGVIERVASTLLPTTMGSFVAVGFRDRISGAHHVALVRGEPSGTVAPLVAVEYECRLGTALRATRCNCRARQQSALRRIDADGHGVFLHLTRPAGPASMTALVSCAEYEGAGSGPHVAPMLAREVLRALGVTRARMLETPAVDANELEAVGFEVACSATNS